MSCRPSPGGYFGRFSCFPSPGSSTRCLSSSRRQRGLSLKFANGRIAAIVRETTVEKSQHFFFSRWRVSQAVFPTLLLLPRIALRGRVEGQASSSPPTSLTVLESCSRRYQRRRGCGPRTRMSSATALRSGCRAAVPTVPGPGGSGRRDRLVPSLCMCFSMVSRAFLVTVCLIWHSLAIPLVLGFS